MESPQTKQNEPGARRIWSIVIAAIVFGGLMAVRHELSSVWARAAVAACAFIVLAWTILAAQKTKS